MSTKSIVCGVTGSKRGQMAALDAAVMARKIGAMLTYVHVVDISFLQGKIPDPLSRAFVEESLVYLGMQIVEHAAQIAQTEGVWAEKHLTKGPVRKSLHKVAREIGADILMLGGNGGKTRFRKVLKLAGGEEQHQPEEDRLLKNEEQQATQG